MSRSTVIIGIIGLVTACFMPWVYIASVQLQLTGVDTTGTLYGKPGYLHFLLAALILAFTFIPAIWAKRFNLLFAALNLGWGLRNWMVMTRCEGGDCPEKQWGIYLMLAASVIIMIAVLFPKVKLSNPENGQ